MTRFVQGESRTQGTFLPELRDDHIAENNPVRVIDVFVDELDLGQLGFEGVAPALTGRPSYHTGQGVSFFGVNGVSVTAEGYAPRAG